MRGLVTRYRCMGGCQVQTDRQTDTCSCDRRHPLNKARVSTSRVLIDGVSRDLSSTRGKRYKSKRRAHAYIHNVHIYIYARIHTYKYT